MNLSDITTKGWILALFVRDDGERLLLGDGWFDFKDSLQHFQANTIANDVVELQGTDGQLLAGQVQRSGAQNFDGYVGDNTISQTEIEKRRRQFLQFFQIRRFYKVVYIFPDGTAIDRKRGYLVEAPTIPEMWQKFPEYHVALNFENANYYEYAENAEGDEIFANTSMVKLANIMSGGLVWDADGAVTYGYIWLDPKTVTGDYIMINDGATGSPLTLSQLSGNAEQTTYSGKNLLPILDGTTTFGNLTFTVAEGELTINGTSNTAGHVKLTNGLAGASSIQASWLSETMPATDLNGKTMSLDYDSGTPTTSSCAFRIYGSTSMHLAQWYPSTTDQKTTFSTSNTPSCFAFFFNSGVSFTNYKLKIQLETGSAQTSFEKYVGGTPAPNPQFPMPISTVTGEQTVKVTGKNLFDYASASDTANTTVTQYRAFAISGLMPNAGYTMNGQTVQQITDTNKFIYLWSASTYSGAERKASLKSASTVSFDANEEGKIYLAIYPTDTTTWTSILTEHFTNAQLELGSTATTYEPYQGQSYTIDLDSIELAKIGTYQDRIYKEEGKWYIEKQVGKVVLDGTEGWGYVTLNNGYFQTSYSLSNLVAFDGINALCDHFTPRTRYAVATATTNDLSINLNGTYCAIRYQAYTDADAFKTWLASNPTTVYYALATPTTTEITDETLLSQLNFIASLYGGVNNISLIGTGAQGTITIQYYADVDTTQAGYEWEEGAGGGATNITVQGIANAQPIWTVTGPAINPTLTNVTTGQSITWTGTVPSGQKLVVDMDEQTAKLSGANVYANISGTWIELKPGTNRLTYVAGGGAEAPSKIEWNGVVG